MRLDPRAVGVTSPATPTVVEASRVDALCAVINDDNPAFANGWRGGPALAPPTFINCFRDNKSQLLIDVLGIDIPKLLHGEQVMNYYHPIRVGDIVYQKVGIVEVEEKETRAMGPADFFKVHIMLEDEEGTLLTDAYQSFFVRSGS